MFELILKESGLNCLSHLVVDELSDILWGGVVLDGSVGHLIVSC